MWILPILSFTIIAVLTCLVYRRYSSFCKEPWYVPSTVLLGWFFSFSIVFLIPIDVSSSLYDSCESKVPKDDCSEPWDYLDQDILLTIWRVIYWTLYVMCWTAYPLLQSYSLAGGFTILDRMRSAIIENLVIYGISGAIMLILLIWIAAKSGITGARLMGIAIAFANGWGLLLVILLMGYGLVEIPRTLWRQSNRRTMMKYYQFKAVSLYDDLSSAEEKLEEVLKTVKKLEETVSEHDPWHPYVLQIIQKGLPEYEDIYYGEGTLEITMKELVKLDQRVTRAKYIVHRNKCLYNELLSSALALQDVIQAENNPSGDRVIHWSFHKPRVGRFAGFINLVEWIWKMWLETTTLRILAALCVILSVTLLWSEVTFSSRDDKTGKGPDLSIWSLLIHAHGLSDFLRQFLIFDAVLYLAVCVYWSLFHFRFFDLFHLIPHQLTDASTLFFTALYLGRLTAPLVYNFLNMIHNTQTAFYKLMGDMASVPVLGTDFNTYLPIALVIVVLATAFNLYSRIANLLHIRRFQFDESWNDAQVDEGADLLKRERLMRERKERGETTELSETTQRALRTKTTRLLEDRPKSKGKEIGHSRSREARGTDTGGLASKFPRLSRIFNSRNVDVPVNEEARFDL